MKYLIILLTMMTWTVQDKRTVSGDGQWPYDIEVTYANTYQSGDVRQGDTAVLTLGNLGGIALETIEVYVKSNKSSGAGIFSVYADGRLISSKSGSFRDWFGGYDNENYHALTLPGGRADGVQQLEISLVGTTNSLHIEKYVINYTPCPARTVTLMKGNGVYTSLTEESGMQGVILPLLPDTAEWQFVGWAEQEVEREQSLPDIYEANAKFYPEEDCTLWAVYKYDDRPEEVYVSNLQSGEYMYVNRELNIALTGVPDSYGRMAYSIADILDDKQHYYFHFVSSDTAYITHVKTGTPIGHSGTKLVASASPWLVYHEGEQTLFYTIVNQKTYVFWLNVYASGNIYAGLLDANLGPSPVALRVPRRGSGEMFYTSHPERGLDIEEVEIRNGGARGRWMFPFGPYKLIIQDGKKYLETGK